MGSGELRFDQVRTLQASFVRCAPSQSVRFIALANACMLNGKENTMARRNSAGLLEKIKETDNTGLFRVSCS